MKRTSLDSEIRRRIDALLQDISNLVKTSALDAVKNVLGAVDSAPAAVATRAAAAPRAPRARGKRAKRTSDQVAATAATILAHVQANAGQRLEEISAALQMPTKEMKLPVQNLLRDGALHTQGQKRGTRYFAGGKRAGRKAKARKA